MVYFAKKNIQQSKLRRNKGLYRPFFSRSGSFCDSRQRKLDVTSGRIIAYYSTVVATPMLNPPLDIIRINFTLERNLDGER